MQLPKRISWNESGKVFRVHSIGDEQEYFGVREHGSKEKALEAAKEYELSLPWDHRLGARYPREEPDCRNTSGVVGVSLYRNKITGEPAGYRAQWSRFHGGYGYASFSFAVYGEVGAWDKACSAREHGVAEELKKARAFMKSK